MLVILVVCRLLSLESSLERITQVGVVLNLHYRPSPGFHQKVEIRSLRERVSFLARVVIRNQIPLVPASIVLVCGLVFMLL